MNQAIRVQSIRLVCTSSKDRIAHTTLQFCIPQSEPEGGTIGECLCMTRPAIRSRYLTRPRHIPPLRRVKRECGLVVPAACAARRGLGNHARNIVMKPLCCKTDIEQTLTDRQEERPPSGEGKQQKRPPDQMIRHCYFSLPAPRPSQSF